MLSFVGNTATSYFAMGIAIHTFNTLVLRNRPGVWLCIAGVSAGWLLALGGCEFYVISNRAFLKFTFDEAFAAAFISTSDSGHLLGANGFTCGLSRMYRAAAIGLLVVPVSVYTVLRASGQ